jgi:hypothetical protein
MKRALFALMLGLVLWAGSVIISAPPPHRLSGASFLTCRNEQFRAANTPGLCAPDLQPLSPWDGVVRPTLREDELPTAGLERMH